ncbi:toll/interleukin-1 receptor domain-containing protein, partial [Accumulibacter sp.]
MNENTGGSSNRGGSTTGDSPTTGASPSYFVSHSSGDDGIVRWLHRALGELDTSLTIDSRAFRGGEPLESTIRAAIDGSSGVLVLVSPKAYGSAWVG